MTEQPFRPPPADEPPVEEPPAIRRVHAGGMVLDAILLNHARCPVCSQPVAHHDDMFVCEMCDAWYVVVRE